MGMHFGTGDSESEGGVVGKGSIDEGKVFEGLDIIHNVIGVGDAFEENFEGRGSFIGVGGGSADGGGVGDTGHSR
jgi:hypothetical protein